MEMKKIITLLILLISINANAVKVKCPISPNAFEPILKSKVSFDKKTSSYTYQYSLENSNVSKVPIFALYIQTLMQASGQKAPRNWSNNGFRSEWINESMDWSGKDIEPGQSVSGFELQSKYPPGPTKFAMLGSPNDVPTVIMDTPSDEGIIPVCPGFYLEGSSSRKPVVTGITIGPVPPSRIVAKIRIKRLADKKYHGQHDEDPTLQLSPLDKGKIQILVLGDKDLDVLKIDLASLRFGQGQAKPIKTLIVDDIKDDCDSNMKEHLKKNKAKNLLIEFDLLDVNILCDIDRALFLTGKYETKDLFGGVKIKHVICDKKTFSKEEKLIKKDGHYKDPH